MTAVGKGDRRFQVSPNVATALRFAAAGVINTLIGVAITLTLDIAFQVKPALANAAGYAVGIVVSWTLQRRFVFRSSNSGWATRSKYFAVIAFSFALNQGVLWAMPFLVGVSPLARTFSQLVAMGTYTTAQFILLKLWVFRPARVP